MIGRTALALALGGTAALAAVLGTALLTLDAFVVESLLVTLAVLTTVALDAVVADLHQTAATSIQPTSFGLWLRPTTQ